MFVIDSDYLFVSIVRVNDNRKVGNFDPHLDDWTAMNFYDMCCVSSKKTTMEWTGEKINGFTFLSGSRYYQNQLPYGREGGEFKVIPAVIDEVETFIAYMRPIVLASHYLDKAWQRYSLATTRSNESTTQDSYLDFYKTLRNKIEQNGWYAIQKDDKTHAVFKANQPTTILFENGKWKLIDMIALDVLDTFTCEDEIRLMKSKFDAEH
jgi:hypothetical protein